MENYFMKNYEKLCDVEEFYKKLCDVEEFDYILNLHLWTIKMLKCLYNFINFS